MWRAYVDLVQGFLYVATDDRAAQFAAAEAALTKALSLAPEHAFAHACLGYAPNPDQPRGPRHSRMRTGVGAGSKFGLTLMQLSVWQSYVSVAPRKPRHMSKRHSALALAIRSPIRGCRSRASPSSYSVATMRRSHGMRRAIEMNRNYPLAYFHLAAALAHLNRLDEARSAVQAGLALTPTFTLRRFRAGATR